MPFKVGTIKDAESTEVAIKDPTTGKRIASVTIAGPEHPKRKAIEFSKQRRMLATLSRTGKLDLVDPAEAEEEKVDLLVASTLGWSGFVGADDEPLECTAENVRKMYTTQGHGWLRRILLDAMEDKDRFVTGSAAA